MIARCMERMRGGACATCDNRRVCPAGRWQQAFAEPKRAGGSFLGLLASVVRAVEAADRPAGNCARREVEDAIVPLLATGEASAARVAASLGVSRQTLYRRLRAEGTSFDELLLVKRRQLAIRYLGVERVPVKTAAWRLGFSSPAAFSRAFKRWTGSPPSRFQRSTG